MWWSPKQGGRGRGDRRIARHDSHLAAEAVMGMSFDQLTIESRRKILAELEDLNKQLSFTARGAAGEFGRQPGAAAVLRRRGPRHLRGPHSGHGRRRRRIRRTGRQPRRRDPVRRCPCRRRRGRVVCGHRFGREGRDGVRRARPRRGERADLDSPRPPKEGLRHRRTAQVALGAGVVFPRRAVGGADAGGQTRPNRGATARRQSPKCGSPAP